MSNDQVDAAVKFFARLGSAAQGFIMPMDDELTSDEAEQFIRSVDRKIISLRMRTIDERHFRQHPPAEGEPMAEAEVEAIVNKIMSQPTRSERGLLGHQLTRAERGLQGPQPIDTCRPIGKLPARRGSGKW